MFFAEDDDGYGCEDEKYANEKAEDGWNKVVFKDKMGWVSGKYSKLV